jgi:prepilin-type N-terminal cleavage/methylation domain-containing protein
MKRQATGFQLRRGYNLIEIIIVLIIIGILVTFAMPQFSKTRERAFDSEAKANLRLMQAAEKIYRMEIGDYYGPSNVIATINSNLKLSLPGTSKWNYSVAATGNSSAARAGGGRTWTLLIGADDATCAGAGCP